MSRSRLVLAACAGLVLVGSGVQASRAARFRTDAHALGSVGVPVVELDAEIAELRTTISRASRHSSDALARPRLDRLADALIHEVRVAGAELTRLSIEPAGPTLALTATGSRLAIARVVSRVDALLDSHQAHAGRFALAGGHEDGASIDLSVIPGPERTAAPVAVAAEPTVNPALVARALEPTRASSAATVDPPISRTDAPVVQPSRRAAADVIRWIGTITTGGAERYVLRFEHERVVASLGEGEAPVFGWSVLSRDEELLHLGREGILYEVHR